VRLWKVALQRFADETRITLQVRHLPPGTSKWNKIEHRMFCHITQNWRGKPLESLAVIVDLIGHTPTVNLPQRGFRPVWATFPGKPGFSAVIGKRPVFGPRRLPFRK
jgi:Rhodopirellula transposase DDE domain